MSSREERLQALDHAIAQSRYRNLWRLPRRSGAVSRVVGLWYVRPDWRNEDGFVIQDDTQRTTHTCEGVAEAVALAEKLALELET